MSNRSSQSVSPDFHAQEVSDWSYYYLNLNPPTTSKRLVVCGGREKCDPDYLVRRTGFRWHAIEFVADGQGKLEMDAKRFTLRPGTVFHYGPGIPHTIQNNRDDGMVKYFVNFTVTQNPSLLDQCPPLRNGPIQATYPREILDIFLDLQREGQRPGTRRMEICVSMLELLLLKLADASMPYGDSSSNVAQATFLRCKQHLETHYLQIHTVEDLAEAVALNPSYMCRLYQRFGRLSPYQAILALKMQKACEWIASTSLSIQDIARKIGFEDPHHFSRRFKSQIGMPPTQFRATAFGQRPPTPQE